jgi:hypothetical protein
MATPAVGDFCGLSNQNPDVFLPSAREVPGTVDSSYHCEETQQSSWVCPLASSHCEGVGLAEEERRQDDRCCASPASCTEYVVEAFRYPLVGDSALFLPTLPSAIDPPQISANAAKVVYYYGVSTALHSTPLTTVDAPTTTRWMRRVALELFLRQRLLHCSGSRPWETVAARHLSGTTR